MYRLCENLQHINIKIGCELPEDGDQSKHVEARYGEIYISIICTFVGTTRL